MQSQLVARPYAEGLFDVLEEEDLFVEVMEQYKWFLDFVEKDSQFQGFLISPKISRAAKVEFIENRLRGKFNDKFVNFLLILAKKGRLFLLDNVHTLVEKAIERKGGKIRVSITTAVKLNKKSKDRVKEVIQDKLHAQAILQEHVDPEIIGGFIMRVEETLINGSIKNQLDKVRNRILERSKTYGL